MIVDNRGGVISMELAAKAPADGHTPLLASGSLWTSQFLRDNVAWDAVRDYAPISFCSPPSSRKEIDRQHLPQLHESPHEDKGD